MVDRTEALRRLLEEAQALVGQLDPTPENRATAVALADACHWQAVARAIATAAGGTHPVALAWEEV